ncbi:MAG TPA: hypothetical protein PLQ36_02305 [Candidatus Gracilibacteria bacterium]|nr:hypothetical protein [Candidatus Gracilibacteria bacterium]
MQKLPLYWRIVSYYISLISLPLFAFSAGIITYFSLITWHNSEPLAANILFTPLSDNKISAQDIPPLFPELENFMEIEISPLSRHENNRWFVKFLATTKNGDSLHPYTAIITKDPDGISKDLISE